MTYDVIITEQADSDLRGIYEYIAFELRSPENAAGQLERIEKSIISLEVFPEKFRRYEREPWHSREMRIMPVDNYCIYYVVNKDVQRVTVIRVMYDGRDADRQLAKSTM